MSRSELIERVEAELIAGKLEQGTEKFRGYLVMDEKTLMHLFDLAPGTVRSFFSWKGVPIDTRTDMAFGEVVSVPTLNLYDVTFQFGGQQIFVDKQTQRGTMYTLSTKSLTKLTKDTH